MIFVNIIGKRQGDSQLKIPAMIKGWVVVCISFTFLTCFFKWSPIRHIRRFYHEGKTNNPASYFHWKPEK